MEVRVSSKQALHLCWLLILLREVCGKDRESRISTADDDLDLDHLFKVGFDTTNVEGDVIFLLGTTGGGKSTLSKFLRRDKTLKVALKGVRYIFVDDEAKIGSTSLTSKTLNPNVDVDPETGILIVDCAGFEDTWSQKMDLLVAFLNKLVLDSAKRLKIIIVENLSNVIPNENRSAFPKTLKHIGYLLKSNINSFGNSFGLIATKVDSPLADKDVINEVTYFLNESLDQFQKSRNEAHKNKLSPSEVEALDREIFILQSLLQENRVAIFRRTRKLGLPWRSKPLRNNLLLMRHVIFNVVQFSTPFAGKFHITVDPKTVYYIKDVILKQSTILESHIFSRLFRRLRMKFDGIIESTVRPWSANIYRNIEFCQHYEKTMSIVVTLSQLESFVQRRDFFEDAFLADLKFLILKRGFLYDAVGRTRQEAEHLEDFHGHKNELLSHVKNRLEFYEFFKEINIAVDSYQFQQSLFPNPPNLKKLFRNFDLYGFNDQLTYFALNLNLTAKLVTDFASSTLQIQESKSSDSVLTVRGRYIILSKVVPQIGFGLNELVLVASKKIFVDCDLEMQHTHLVMVAPVIEVVGSSRSIYLRGENGTKPGVKAPKAALRNKGKAGNAGINDAFSSGSLKLFTLKIVNSQLLTLKTEGGIGGNGQDGGDGGDAEPRPAASFKSFIGYHEILKERFQNSGHYLHYSVTNREYSPKYGALIGWSLSVNITGHDHFAPPTNGGNGGSAGVGAASGEQVVNVRDTHNAAIVLISGRHGQPGRGGSAGKTSARCYETIHDCEGVLTSIGRNGWMAVCKLKHSKMCTMYKSAVPGIDGKPATGTILQRYKKKETSTYLSILLQYLLLVFDQSIESEFNDTTKEFISFLLQAGFNDFKLNYYLYFLKAINDLKFQFNPLYGYDFLFNLKYVYIKVTHMYREYLNLCQNCDHALATLIEFLLIEEVDKIDSLFYGKQIVKLSARVEQYLNDITDTRNYLVSYGKFQQVESERQSIMKEISDAGVMINNLYELEIAELERSMDEKFNEVLIKVAKQRTVYAHNIEKLKSMKIDLNSAMIASVFMGLVNTVGLITSIFFPVASILTLSGTTLAASVMSAADTNYTKYQPITAKGMLNARKALENIEIKLQLENTSMTEVVRTVIESEKDVGKYLSDSNRNKAVAIVDEPSKVSINTTLVIKALKDNIDAKISKLKQSNGSAVTIKRLEGLKTKLTVAVNAAGATAEIIANTVKRYSHDMHVMTELHSSIQANQVALKDLAEYEKVLSSTFKPALGEMARTFDKYQAKLLTDNAFELEFRKLDFNKFARECISIINRVTEGFGVEYDSLREIMSNLQEFLTIMINAYTKIREYEYRARLTDLIGNMNSGQCSKSLSSDPELCNLFLSVSAEIDGNKLTKNFVHIFRAFQQNMFPYGGERMQLLSSTMSTLMSKSAMTVPDKLNLLQGALKTIKEQLSEDDHSIVNDRDRYISVAKFSSNYKSRRPFFVWPASRHGAQISKLFSGHQVSFVASVLQPGTQNAVKFKTIMLHVTSKSPVIGATVRRELDHFELEMIHGGESYYKCGARFYSIPGDKQIFKISFERDEKGEFVSFNRIWEKLSYGDVPMSPYTLWRFQLKCKAKEKDCPLLFKTLSSLAHQVDLELIGSGYYLEDDAPICKTDLSCFYSTFANSIL